MVPISYKWILRYIIISPEAESIIKLSISCSIQTNLLAGCASDRSVLLYDMRGSAPLRKVILKMKSNALAWNPMEAFVFTVANEDYKYALLSFYPNAFIQIISYISWKGVAVINVYTCTQYPNYLIWSTIFLQYLLIGIVKK